METVTVHSSRVYIGMMTGLLFVVGAGGLLFGFAGERLFSSLMIQIISGIMVLSSFFSFTILWFRITFSGDRITVKQWKTREVTAADIRHVDFSFAKGKNGSYFIALNDGDSIFLLRRIFSYKLSTALKDFCNQNKIEIIDKNNKGVEQENGEI